MGGDHSETINKINLKTTPVYCVGFASDITFAADEQWINKVLFKLKSYEKNQLFKYRIREQQLLEYFCKYSSSNIVVKPWKKPNCVLGIIIFGNSYKMKVKNLMMILRKDLTNISEGESIFLYEKGKLCHQDQIIQPKNNQNQVNLKQFSYSHLQISG